MQLTTLSSSNLVDQSSIIKTYSAADQLSCQKYFEYLELVNQIPSIGYKKAAKLLGVSNGSTRWWHTKGSKKAMPIPIKTAKKLREYSLLPFYGEHSDSKDIFRILGTIFGDGCIDRNLNTMSFISSNLEDVNCWKNDLTRIFSFAKDKMNMVEGGERGHSFCIRTFDRSVIRFFVSLGAPVGSKVTNDYILPKYLFSLSKSNKIAFLDGLLSSEISVPVFRSPNSDGYWKRFTNFQFGLSKILQLEDSHICFLNDFKKLSESVGLRFTPNLRKDLNMSMKRKDGRESYSYRVFLQTHFGKILAFNKMFPLKYALDKKRRLEKEIEIALNSKQTDRLLISAGEPKPFNDSLE